MGTKKLKPRIEFVELERHIIDCWKLLRQSHQENPQLYPSLHEVDDQELRAHLIKFLSKNNQYGMIMKLGRKPIAQILGCASRHELGRPEKFLFIWNFYISEEHRKQGLMKELLKAYFKWVKSEGLHYWESKVNDGLSEIVLEHFKGEKAYNYLYGKI